MYLKRKIETILNQWKNEPGKTPIIVKGARQIGKTYSIEKFGKENFKNVVSINFTLQKEYRRIFDDGYEVDAILRNISFINPELEFIPGFTLIFFDELQDCIAAATSLKSFKLDGRYDVICSGSMMGINYQEIESNSVGHKIDVEMFPLDFEEFLWANGYDSAAIEQLYDKMISVVPLTAVEFERLSRLFRDYMVVGGMPAVVDSYITNRNFSGTLQIQRQLLLDYEEDITKYAVGLDKAKILNIYNHISIFLAQENKKFRISKIGRGARNRDYIGVIDWLDSAGIINVCYCLNSLELPLKGNYTPDRYKLYHMDPGMLVASLDDEAQYDLRHNRNFATYKGALFENVVASMLRMGGYGLYYYRNEKSTIEIDFFIRDADSLIPVEVKASDNSSKSLVKLTAGKVPDIHFGIKLCDKNIGFNGSYYTFPYYLTFLLKRFLRERPNR